MEKSHLEKKFSPAHEPLNKEDIIKQIIELQKNWSQYVTEQSPLFIQELYEKNLLRFETDNKGKIIAVLYIQPLDESLPQDDPNQVFRIGGLSPSSSLSGQKALIKILRQLEKEVYEKKWNIVGKTDNSDLGEYLKEMGMEELTYEECRVKYPKFIELYLKESKKSAEEYPGKMFYVKTTH